MTTSAATARVPCRPSHESAAMGASTISIQKTLSTSIGGRIHTRPNSKFRWKIFQALPLCKHLQKPHNAGSRPQARFFNTLLCLDREPGEPVGEPPAFGDEAEQVLAGLKLAGVKQLLQDDEDGRTPGVALFRKIREPTCRRVLRIRSVSSHRKISGESRPMNSGAGTSPPDRDAGGASERPAQELPPWFARFRHREA